MTAAVSSGGSVYKVFQEMDQEISRDFSQNAGGFRTLYGHHTSELNAGTSTIDLVMNFRILWDCFNPHLKTKMTYF